MTRTKIEDNITNVAYYMKHYSHITQYMNHYKVNIFKAKGTKDYMIVVSYCVYNGAFFTEIPMVEWKRVVCTSKDPFSEIKEQLKNMKEDTNVLYLFGCDWRADFPVSSEYKNVWVKALKNIKTIDCKYYEFLVNSLENDFRQCTKPVLQDWHTNFQKLQEKIDLFTED